ncbi:hypothetical protein ACFQZC_16240 [Streptacidiphilus monticola]
MRHRALSLALTAALTATASALVAVPAQAASNTLTVTTIGRNGARITMPLVLTNAKTGQVVTGRKSGRSFSSPRAPGRSSSTSRHPTTPLPDE